MDKITANKLLSYFDKGISGYGDDIRFYITGIAERRLKEPIIIPQEAYMLANIVHQTKTLLSIRLGETINK